MRSTVFDGSRLVLRLRPQQHDAGDSNTLVSPEEHDPRTFTVGIVETADVRSAIIVPIVSNVPRDFSKGPARILRIVKAPY